MCRLGLPLHPPIPIPVCCGTKAPEGVRCSRKQVRGQAMVCQIQRGSGRCFPVESGTAVRLPTKSHALVVPCAEGERLCARGHAAVTAQVWQAGRPIARPASRRLRRAGFCFAGTAGPDGPEARGRSLGEGGSWWVIHALARWACSTRCFPNTHATRYSKPNRFIRLKNVLRGTPNRRAASALLPPARANA